jgi:hypothetical protein
MAAQQAADSRGSREEIVFVDLESDEAGVDDDVPATMQRQDSLYMAATRAGGANNHGQVVQYCTTYLVACLLSGRSTHENLNTY